MGADGVGAGADAEVVAIQAGRGRETGYLVQFVDGPGGAVESEGQVHRAGDAAQGQLAVQHAVVLVLARHAGAAEVRVAMRGAVEQRRLAYGLVPVGVAHVEAGQVDVRFGRRRATVTGVEAPAATRDV